MGAIQLARKTGRLHAKVEFLEENQVSRVTMVETVVVRLPP